ncbi:MAG: FAD-linked oxidase C-terminal domain-containing protein [Anaerolineales bacterium]
MQEKVRAAEQELRRLVKDVRFDWATRLLYSTDASAYQIVPFGVVLPRHAEEVQAVMEVANRYRLPILARGAGTSLAGQAVGEALIVDFSRYLNRILEINAEEGWARVEPGVVCDALMAAARRHGLTYGSEPASSDRATFGGMLNNNSTGAHSLLYGMTADQVLSAEVLLADGTRTRFEALSAEAWKERSRRQGLEGEIYRGVQALIEQYADAIRKGYPRTWRRASGYSLNYLLPPLGFTATRPAGWDDALPYPLGGPNLAKLLAGSEGTLAVVLEATFRLVRLPKKTGLCVVHFESVAAAADATPMILESRPTAVELMDEVMIRATRSVPAYARMLRWVQGEPGAVLVVEFGGESEADVLAQIEAFEKRMQRQGSATGFVRAITAQEQADVWGVRKVGLGLLMSVRGDSKPLAFMEDVAVPVEHLGTYVREVERIFRHYGVSSAYYAHASAGCLHIRPSLNLKTLQGVQEMRRIAEEVLEVVIRLGGAMSGEHGDGLSRSVWNERLFGPELYQAFRRLKRIFDPQGLLNPGKIVDAPDMTEFLRYGGNYRSRSLSTHLDFTLEVGFNGAVEQCNGAGVCRKAVGTMCPSYQATREEMHATRGRANLLRALLTLSPERFPSTARPEIEQAVYEALDLCLECKGCKAECPSGVDMAKIKYEYLAQYYRSHGVPMRARLFAYLPRLVDRVPSPFVALFNRVADWPITRRLNERLLGISAQRALPKLAGEPWRKWASRRERRTANRRGQVALFTDTFHDHFHVSAGKALTNVLEALGYEVILPEHPCCGRTLISKGFLEAARKAAKETVRSLAPFAERGIPIVGIEPSCLLTLRDEYRDLLPNDRGQQLVAEHTFLLEEFLVREVESGRLDPETLRSANAPRMLVHTHCHEKALVGSGALLQVLRWTGAQVEEIPSGCCGMAGAFGYEAEHYRVSQAIAEDRLLPAVRRADEETWIVASGFSCRQQIEQGSGRIVLHPAEALERVLRGSGEDGKD